MRKILEFVKSDVTDVITLYILMTENVQTVANHVSLLEQFGILYAYRGRHTGRSEIPYAT